MTTNGERHTSPFAIASSKTAAIVFATLLVAAPALAQRHAQPRSGGGGGGGSSSGQSSGGHRSSGHSSGPSVSSGGRSSSSSSGAHRVPGSGGGAPHRPTGSPRFDHDHGHGHGGHHYYSPYYYSPYRFSFGFGYGYPYSYYPYSYYPYYYGYYRPYGYYEPYYGYPAYGYPPRYGDGDGYAYDRASLGAVALKVRPKTAEVYIDGRYVGAAGSYDGFPGYLWLEPGSYRLEVVQDGYANLDREIEITTGQVLEFKLELEPGVASRPEPSSDRYDARGSQRAPYPEGGGYRPPPAHRGDPRRGSEQEAERGRDPARDDRRDLAEIVLDVRPDDASVYLDGRFVGTGREVSTATEPLVIEPGEHRLQVIHPDFANEERTVTVSAGEEKLVEVTLRRGGGV